MNLFCFSLEGSMDSLYEPVPEQRAHQESASGGTDSLISPSGESGGARSRLFMEVSNFENAKPKRKSIQRSMSESKVFEGKTVNDTIWQEPSKHENDSHIRRLCQLKDLNEDDFLWNNNVHSMQGRKLQDISYQTMKPGGDPAESTGTLKRLQKLVWTKKARVTSLNEMKPMLMNLQDEDETLISCMKLVKSQEKKANNISQKSTEEMEIRLDSISAPLVRSSTSTGRSLAEMLSHNEGEVHMWNSWKPFPENPLWAYVDFQIDQVGAWDPCFHCSHHTCLKSSCTDTDLPHSWEPLIQDPCCLCTQGLITMEEGHMTTV